MSIEAKLDALTAAVEALTDISTRLHDLRATTVEEIKTAAAGAKAPAKSKAAEKPAAEAAAEKPADKPAAEAGTNRLADVQTICAKYASGTDREDERTARKEKLTWLFGKVGATKLAEIPKGKEASVIKAVTQLIADGDLTEAPAADDAGAADDDLLAT